MRQTVVIGDIHGHLQLALCVAARLQRTLDTEFEAVFLCGDVGTFTDVSQLDSTTRRHGKANPCELEFLTQWATNPQAPWLDSIFMSIDDGGLGLTCPVIMVSGNHEGFAHLETLVPQEMPVDPVEAHRLPAVDTNAHIRLLPSGWRVTLPSGIIVGGIGGIEEGQREAKYHPMAYMDPDAVLRLIDKHVDVMITHQGPTVFQGVKGSETLQVLLDHTDARIWCHGHSVVEPEPARAGKDGRCLVVPLKEIAFSGKGENADEPGHEGWCLVTAKGNELDAQRLMPSFLREFRKKKWIQTGEGCLIFPDLDTCYRKQLGKRTEKNNRASP